MKARTLREDSFTTFVHVSILCLRNRESSKEQGTKFVEMVAASERYLIINSGIKEAPVQYASP